MELKNHSNFIWNPIRNLINICESQVPEDYKDLELSYCVELYQSCTSSKEKDFFYKVILGKYIRRLVIISGKAMRKNNWFINWIPLEEFISEALVGFIDALPRFDSRKGVKFESFVEWRINWQIIDFLRKNIWIVRITRGVMTKIKSRIRNATLIDQNNSTESFTSSERFNNEYLRPRDITYDGTEMDKIKIQENSFTVGNLIDKIFFQEIIDKINSWVINLSVREKQVFLLIYGTDWFSQKEIAQILEVSETRINLLKNKTIKKLRKYLEPKKTQA